MGTKGTDDLKSKNKLLEKEIEELKIYISEANNAKYNNETFINNMQINLSNADEEEKIIKLENYVEDLKQKLVNIELM